MGAFEQLFGPVRGGGGEGFEQTFSKNSNARAGGMIDWKLESIANGKEISVVPFRTEKEDCRPLEVVYNFRTDFRTISFNRNVRHFFVSFPQKRNGIVFSSGVNYLHSGGNIQSE